MTPASATGPWLAVPRPNPSAPSRLFCFPYAGGGASVYRRWADTFPPSVELCAIQLPGRETRFEEPTFDRLPPLVEALGRALGPALDRPFTFFGHSLGALVNFELTRWLRRLGRPLPARLLVSARRAPQLPSHEPPIHALPEPAFRRKLRRLDGTPAAVLDNDELMALVLPVLRADFAVGETYAYTPEAPLDVPVTAFAGRGDPLASPEQMEPWRDQTTAAFRLQVFPGGHFFLNTATAALLEAVARECAAPEAQR